jgi:hypothetical protein
MRNFQTVGMLASVLAFGSAACSVDVRGEGSVLREEKRFTVGAAPEVRVRTFDGAVRVKSWDRNEVLLEIERRGPDNQTAEALVVNATQEGNRIVIEAPSPEGQRNVIHFGSWQSPSVALTVTVPRRVTIEARTGDGSITVDDLAGTVGLDSGDGSIRASRIEGRIRAHTGDGSITISDAVGQVEADSGDGSIELGGRLELVDVRTGDGSVRADIVDGSVMKSDWTINTGDGSIALRVPGNLDAELDAHSGDGRVHADGIAQAERSPDDDDSGTLRGRFGKGGRTLRLRSGDGSIDVSRR